MLEPKANLFSTISTIERIVENFKGGKIQPNIYRKQLNALVREYYALTNQLLRSGFNLRRFYREEGIIKRFPQAFERINNKQLDSTDTTSTQQEQKKLARTSQSTELKLAAHTARLVSCYITIGDSARLKMVATKDMLVPLFDECLLVLPKLPILEENYWVTKEIHTWRDKLEQMPLKEALPDEQADSLAYNADRWLKDLQLRLNLES
ncbi:MAG: hypothetical protein ACXACA_06220 [Candidatus Ranarchaeia archaeon]